MGIDAITPPGVYVPYSGADQDVDLGAQDISGTDSTFVTAYVGGATGVKMTAADGILEIQGQKSGGYNETIRILLDTGVDDQITITTTGSSYFTLVRNLNISSAAIRFFDTPATLVFGDGYDVYLLWQTVGNDNLQMGLKCGSAGQSGYFCIMEYADMGNANRSPLATTVNPTQRIYSADAGEALDYIEFYHDQTDGVIATGGGNLNLRPAGYVDMNTDLVFNGAGSGLPYGSIYSNTPQDIVCTDEDEWYAIGLDEEGVCNLLTCSIVNSTLTMPKTGVYRVAVEVCKHSAASNDFEYSIFKNGTIIPNSTIHETTAIANKDSSSSVSALVSLAANDVLSVKTRCTDADNKTITIEHANFNAMMIGG